MRIIKQENNDNILDCKSFDTAISINGKKTLLKNAFMLVGVILVSVFALFFLSKIVTIRWEIFGDGIQYVKMSLDNFYQLSAPFCHRMFVPWFAHYLGEPPNAWLILNCAFMFLTGIGLYYFLREFKFNYLECLLGVWVFYMSHLGHIHWWRIYNVDTASFFTIVLAFLAMKKGRDDWFAFILFIGVLFKETILLVVPVYYFINATKVLDFRVLKRTALVCSFAIAAFLAIRLIHWYWQGIILYENSYSNLYLPTVANVKANLMAQGGILETLRIIWFVWGPIWAFSVIGILRGNKFLNKSLLFILVNLAFIFVATDVERFTSFAFVVLIPLFLLAVHRYYDKKLKIFWAISLVLIFLYIPVYGKLSWATLNNVLFTISNDLGWFLAVSTSQIVHSVFPLYFLLGEIFIFMRAQRKKLRDYLPVLVWGLTLVFSFFPAYNSNNPKALRNFLDEARIHIRERPIDKDKYSLKKHLLIKSDSIKPKLARDFRWLQYHYEMNDTYHVRKIFNNIGDGSPSHTFKVLTNFVKEISSTGKAREAERIADIAGMIDPYDFELYDFRAKFLAKHGDYNKVIFITEEFRKRHKYSHFAMLYHMMSLKSIGNLEYGKALAETLLYYCEKNPRYAFDISEFFRQQDNEEDAQFWLMFAQKLSENKQFK